MGLTLAYIQTTMPKQVLTCITTQKCVFTPSLRACDLSWNNRFTCSGAADCKGRICWSRRDVSACLHYLSTTPLRVWKSSAFCSYVNQPFDLVINNLFFSCGRGRQSEKKSSGLTSPTLRNDHEDNSFSPRAPSRRLKYRKLALKSWSERRNHDHHVKSRSIVGTTAVTSRLTWWTCIYTYEKNHFFKHQWEETRSRFRAK